MPFATLNGIDLYYETHGSGPALVFTHGGGGNHLSWWQQVPAFSQHYTVVTAEEFNRSVEEFLRETLR
jgi:3-oxoadipate enol-lactonase